MVTNSATLAKAGELVQHRQPHALTFLRVKLRREDVVLPYGRREARRIVGFGGDQARIRRHYVIRVDEIDRRALSQDGQVWRRLANVELVPTHMGDLEA